MGRLPPVVAALGPILRKIYKDDDKYRRVMEEHYSFFNTNTYTANIVLGATVAMEEKAAEEDDFEESRKAVTSIKMGLMGPLAGVGDSIFFVIPITIFGAIAAYMALQGSPLGMLLGLAFSFAILFLRKKMFDLGYSQGSKFVGQLAGQLKNLTNSANIRGMSVVGALISSIMSVEVPLVFQQGKVVAKVQTTLDSIMPCLVPAALVAFVYWLLGRKGMTSTKVILIVLLIAFIGFNTGILGVAGGK